MSELFSPLLFFLLSLVALVIGASLMVKYITRIAEYLRLSDFVISFVIIGTSTSLPELFIGITSAIDSNPTLSLGNLIGANIAVLTTVVGIPLLFSKGMKMETKSAKTDVTYMMMIAALPMVLMSIGNELSRLDGSILIAVYVLYLYRMLKEHKDEREEFNEKVSTLEFVADSLMFILCLVLVLGSAHYVVLSATALAFALELPLILIGLVLLGIGTTVPELTFGIQSVRKGHPEMALGDSIGSVVVNSSLVLGIVAFIHPITESILLYFTSWAFLLLVCLIFLTFIKGEKVMGWREGVALIALYFFFIITEVVMKGVGVG